LRGLKKNQRGADGKSKTLGQVHGFFGFAVKEVDGHDHLALLHAFSFIPFELGKPSCLIAQTIKGKGVSFAENKPAWHHDVPTIEQLGLARRELGVEVDW
jgi:transketolase